MLRTAIAFCPVAFGVMAHCAFAATDVTVTFNREVLPILQKECQSCHRPGEVAPMSFLTYSQTRPWAKAIRDAVSTRKMPPWFADPAYGRFRNERLLSADQISTLVSWANNGAPEGDPADRPAPVQFTEGWTIGKPDLVIEMPKDIPIPAAGIVDQSNVLVKVNFPRDVWVSAAEVRPGNSRVVHHMKAWIRPPGSIWMSDAPEGELYKPGWAGTAIRAGKQSSGAAQEILAKYNPGVEGQEFALAGAAKFIPAGSDIVFECHYVPSGKSETDRSRVGLVFAKEPPSRRYVTLTGLNNSTFVIPALAANHEVKAEAVIQQDAELAWVQPHMHYRAKDYELRLHYPSGESEIAMKTKFDFNWQLGYEFAKPVVLPKGTRLEMIVHYDNSRNNPYNPDPNRDVPYGPQSTDEMAVSFMGFVVDTNIDPAKLFPRKSVPQILE